MKNVAVVGTVGIPACYGGFESLVENLTKYKSEDTNYYIFCSAPHYKKKQEFHNGAKLIYIPLNANGMQSVFYDIYSLIKCFFLKPDAILILGVSGCIFLPFFRIMTKSKVITNIDGLEWKRDKWSFLAKKFLKFSERLAVKFSDVVVTDNQAISNYVYQEYGVKTETIAYGGDHAIRDLDVPGNISEQYYLGICRIEPENNVKMILDAFSRSDKKIKFVGNWDSSSYGKALKDKFNTYPNIELMDPIYNLDQLYILRRGCITYVHGHSAGGTNPSLVEMMHFSVPVFAYDCVFNKYTTENKAHYFDSENNLLNLLDSTPVADLVENARNMKTISEVEYTWASITKSYESIY